MNLLERFMWKTRGKAALHAVEDFDDVSDAVMLPIISWVITAGIAYAAAATLTLEAVLSVPGAVVALGFLAVLGIFGSMSVEMTIGAKYYLTEWTADVRPPEGVR